MNDLYNIISIFIGGSVVLCFGVCFLFLMVKESPLLHSYLAARRVMACAYLFLAAANVAEYLSRSPADNTQLTQMVTLVIGCSQSFLFTYVFITLINPPFLSGRKIIGEVSLFLLFVAALFAFYFLCPAAWFHALFTVYVVFYAFLLIRFTRMFLANYRRYRIRMDNYYAGEEARHLRWVQVSFFAALAIGVMALLSALFMSTLGALLFSVVLIAFYVTFAIRFLNYPFVFHYIERTMDSEPAEEILLPAFDEPVAGNAAAATSPDPFAFATLDERIEQWIAGKRFTEKGVTINTLATYLYTNHKYLSVYINTRKKQTFREWINQLRIEEAQTLLRQYPGMTMNEIAQRTGFSDKSNFSHQFKKQTNLSPTAWRNSSLV
ncbi:MAG: helix-turn-helix domain-containing protein [Tannerellaceae bacterium]|jgi:AraC-like DNA-binding protein|nr:helix-turn-helix domain-containing protein [Tannerellaceae bacterium]